MVMSEAYTLSSARLHLSYVPDVPMLELNGPSRCGVYYVYAGDEPAGAVSLTSLSRASGEIGYKIEPEHRGQGFATEALMTVLDGVGQRHGFTLMSAVARGDNAASHRVLEKAGFKQVASKLCWLTEGGEPAAIRRYLLNLA